MALPVLTGGGALDIPVGIVTHYYDAVGTAMVSISSQALRTGDAILIRGPKTSVTFRIEALISGYESIAVANSGDVVGIVVPSVVQVGDIVCLVSTKTI